MFVRHVTCKATTTPWSHLQCLLLLGQAAVDLLKKLKFKKHTQVASMDKKKDECTPYMDNFLKGDTVYLQKLSTIINNVDPYDLKGNE